jgi:hypothetical protein
MTVSQRFSAFLDNLRAAVTPLPYSTLTGRDIIWSTLDAND